jgi:hypothetical protein
MLYKRRKEIISDGNRRTSPFCHSTLIRLHGVPDVVLLPGLRQRVPGGRAPHPRGERHALSLNCCWRCPSWPRTWRRDLRIRSRRNPPKARAWRVMRGVSLALQHADRGWGGAFRPQGAVPLRAGLASWAATWRCIILGGSHTLASSKRR